MNQVFKNIRYSTCYNKIAYQFRTAHAHHAHTNKAAAVHQSNTQNVQLRGTYIKGNYNDLPTLIFFSELFDPVTNWVPFFNNPDNRVLDYRNVWLVNPRNFGNSDRHDSLDIEDQANDVARFMYQHNISTATFGGHGFGAKLALAFGCWHPERTTGVFGIDSGPLDHRYYEPYIELKGYVQKLRDLQLSHSSEKDVQQYLKDNVQCPKWRKIFNQNLSKLNENTFKWNFEMETINKNIQFNKADSLGAWNSRNGLYPGRVMFIAPEYSRWFHLNTNTLAIHKICPRAKGYSHDIFSIQGDDNPLNHWVYDFKDASFAVQSKLLQFLTLYDGVHVLLKDRSEVGKNFIPDRINSRVKADHVYSDYSPAHLHHNWRFSDIYERARKTEENNN